jgi:hypothetical protein
MSALRSEGGQVNAGDCKSSRDGQAAGSFAAIARLVEISKRDILVAIYLHATWL